MNFPSSKPVAAAATKGAKPKRPLSAYNLFYRYKRIKTLDANQNGDTSKETIDRMIAAVPGLEDHHSTQSLSEKNEKELRRNAIRTVLLNNLSPKDTSKRSHRKSHGAMTFLEMNKSMCESWKTIDDFSLSVFEELAAEGRKNHTKLYGEKVKKPRGPYAAALKKAQSKNLRADKPASTPVDVVLQKAPVKEAVMPLKVATTDAVAPKRSVKTKKEAKPKRPLSAYNLFYRFKRSKILAARENGGDSKENVERLVTAVAGLEEYPSIAQTMNADHVKELRRAEIRSALLHRLSPQDTGGRSHRKAKASAISFLQLSKMMIDNWKSIDDFGRSVFEELAVEGRKIYENRLAEYEEQCPPEPTPNKKREMVQSSGWTATPVQPQKTQRTMPQVWPTTPAVWPVTPTSSSSDLSADESMSPLSKIPTNLASLPSDRKGLEQIYLPPMMPMSMALPPFGLELTNQHPMMPTNLSSTFSGCMDPLMESILPMFPEIFKDEHSTDEEHTSEVSTTTSNASDDLPRPSHPVTEEEDEFKRLIATMEL